MLSWSCEQLSKLTVYFNVYKDLKLRSKQHSTLLFISNNINHVSVNQTTKRNILVVCFFAMLLLSYVCLWSVCKLFEVCFHYLFFVRICADLCFLATDCTRINLTRTMDFNYLRPIKKMNEAWLPHCCVSLYYLVMSPKRNQNTRTLRKKVL